MECPQVGSHYVFQRRRCGELDLSRQRSFKIWFTIRYTRLRYTIQAVGFEKPQSTRREPNMSRQCMAEDSVCRLLVHVWKWSEVAVRPGFGLSSDHETTPLCHCMRLWLTKSRSMTSSFRFKPCCTLANSQTVLATRFSCHGSNSGSTMRLMIVSVLSWSLGEISYETRIIVQQEQ